MLKLQTGLTIGAIILQIGGGIAAGALAVPFSVGAIQSRLAEPKLTPKDQAYIDKTFNTAGQDGSKVSGPIVHESKVGHFVEVTATVQQADDKDGKPTPASAKAFVVVFDDADAPLTVTQR